MGLLTRGEAPVLLPDLLRHAAAAVPDLEAIHVDGVGGLRYGEWDARSNAAGRALAARGVGAGDRVALAFSPAEQPAHAVGYFAALKAGAIAACLPPLPARERRRRLETLAPAAVLCSDGAVRELEASEDDSPFQAPVEPDAPAQLVYTSGTTSAPRAVVASHDELLRFSGGPALADPADLQVAVHAMPLGSNAYQTALLGTLRRGPMVVPAAPDPLRMCDLVRSFRARVLYLMPWLAAELLREPAPLAACSSLETVVLTGSPAPPALLERLAPVVPAARIVETYTTVEAFPAFVGGLYDPTRPDALGLAGPHTDVTVVDEGGRALPTGGTGTICLRYTAAGPRRLFVDGALRQVSRDGWVDTGDLGFLDADGYVYLVDRAADLIGSGGKAVSSLRVVAALREHPAVVEAACVGLPHRARGEVPAAAVRVCTPVSAAALRAFARLRLPEWAVPERIEVVETLDRTWSLKVDKRRLRDRLRQRGPARPARPAAAEAEPLPALVLETWSTALRRRLGLDDDLGAATDVGAAERSCAELSSALHVDVPVEAAVAAGTARRLAAWLAARLAASEQPAEARFLDCHTHVVPSGDDGAPTIEAGRALCEEARRCGTAVVFATPHVWPRLPLTPAREQAVRASHAELAAAVELEVRLGFEVTPHDDLLHEDPERYRLAGTPYVLVDTPLSGKLDALFAFARHVESAGLRPLIAHPERSRELHGQRQLARELAGRFAVQVNAASLSGSNGIAADRLAWELVSDSGACVVASDAHGPARPARLDLVHALLRARLGEERASRLLEGGGLDFA